MIIITKGSCAFLGKFERDLFAGDVIIVPTGQEHGFSACLGEDMEGLSIQFEGHGLYEDIHNPRVVFQRNLKEKLLDKNKQALGNFIKLLVERVPWLKAKKIELLVIITFS